MNRIQQENNNPGRPQIEWDVPGIGDPTIQGFATDMSVNAGDTVCFKVKTDAMAYQLKIYRMGFYQGNGARLMDTVLPLAGVQLPQEQPDGLTDEDDEDTGLLDCGNWAISASWAVPPTAVSGIYFAKLVRSDTGGASHIVFVVRNDGSHSDLVFQTSDLTWQAYNFYGGKSLYGDLGTDNPWDLENRAYKVSYNRPFTTRRDASGSWVFYAEYPMVRWLEANGYAFYGSHAADEYGRFSHQEKHTQAGETSYSNGYIQVLNSGEIYSPDPHAWGLLDPLVDDNLRERAV